MKMILLVLGVLAAVFVAWAAAKSKKPIRTAMYSGVLGAASLGAVNIAASYTGVAIALNYGTALIAVVLGVPGVITMLLLRVLTLS